MISIIIMAHNEEKIIKDRIENCLSLNYSKKHMEIIVASDASTDETVKIAKGFGEMVKVIDSKVRNKTKTRERAIAASKGDILFFTDSDTLYSPDFVKKIVRHYSNPKVGCVGGELRSRSFEDGALGKGQGIYWRCEYLFRRIQSRLGVLTKVSGAAMSIRKSIYKPLPEILDIDQAAGPLSILQGYKVVHEPEAIAYERFPTSLDGELSTRRRLALRGLTAVWYYRTLLNPLKYPLVALNLFFYRLFRYFIPFFLIIIFISNVFLLGKVLIFNILFLLQLVFYSSAVIGYFLERKNISIKYLSFPFAFCWFNIGFLLGVFDFILGKRVKSYKSVE